LVHTVQLPVSWLLGTTQSSYFQKNSPQHREAGIAGWIEAKHKVTKE
jgi:hypothetical protein